MVSEKHLRVLMTLFKTRPIWGFIPVRIAFGSILLMHGISRLLEARAPSSTFLADLPNEAAYGIVLAFAVVECVGGLLMIPGFLARFAGFLLVIEMIASITIERLPLGFEEVGLPFELLLFAVAGMFLISGAGRMSFDRAIARRLLCRCPDEKHEAYIVAETIYTRWYE